MSADADGVSGTSHDNLAEDVSSLRQDMAKMQEILSKFVSEAGGHMAASATRQLKTFTNEFEDIARKNPLGALAGALVLGIVIGLIVRRR
jgi:ElaB/YqjD/DUF883 family membrane-anchored ribosome-binding protein